MNAATAAQDIQELMNGWNTIAAAARKQFPAATEEELYQIAKGAMNHVLGSASCILEQMKRDEETSKGRFAAAQAASRHQQKADAPVGPMEFVGKDADGFAVFRGASVL